MNKVKFLTASVLALFALAPMAHAAPVSGSVNVDNDFIVVLSVTDSSGNTSNTKVYSGANARRWNRREDFSFDVPNDATNRQCSVNVIAWGDNAVSQGFAGIFRGPDGVRYTGGPGISAQATGIPSQGWANTATGGPNSTQIDTILAGAFSPNPFQIPGTVTGGTNPWGSINYTGQMSGVPSSGFKWVWPTSNQMTGQYSAFRMNCADMVKQVVPIPDPIDVPGDHMQCYTVQKGQRLKSETLYIEDQFGGTKAVLGKPIMLCNPSAKQHGKKEYGVRNKQRHLVCYDYVEAERHSSQDLMINNQMGPDKIVTRKRAMFCVPSYKWHLDKEGNPIPNGTESNEGKPRGKALKSPIRQKLERAPMQQLKRGPMQRR